MRLLTFLTICLILNSCSRDQSQEQEVRVDLRGQHLTSIPDRIFQMEGLTYLNLGSSEITFYPPLSALVDSNANQISELPDEIGKLTNLKTLILNSNNLTTLPNAITKLTNLEVLDLSLNKNLNIIQELDKLKQLPKLKTLLIVDVEMKNRDTTLVKSSFKTGTKVIFSIPEYVVIFKDLP